MRLIQIAVVASFLALALFACVQAVFAASICSPGERTFMQSQWAITGSNGDPSAYIHTIASFRDWNLTTPAVRNDSTLTGQPPTVRPFYVAGSFDTSAQFTMNIFGANSVGFSVSSSSGVSGAENNLYIAKFAGQAVIWSSTAYFQAPLPSTYPPDHSVDPKPVIQSIQADVFNNVWVAGVVGTGATRAGGATLVWGGKSLTFQTISGNPDVSYQLFIAQFGFDGQTKLLQQLVPGNYTMGSVQMALMRPTVSMMSNQYQTQMLAVSVSPIRGQPADPYNDGSRIFIYDTSSTLQTAKSTVQLLNSVAGGGTCPFGNCNSQVLIWSLQSDNNGGLYVAGQFLCGLIFRFTNGGTTVERRIVEWNTARNSFGYFVAKINVDSTTGSTSLVWTSIASGSSLPSNHRAIPMSLAVDSRSGNLYLAGVFAGGKVYAGDSSRILYQSSNDVDVFVMKLSGADGTQIWGTASDGYLDSLPNSATYNINGNIAAAVNDNDGSLHVALSCSYLRMSNPSFEGTALGSGGTMDIFVLKLDPDSISVISQTQIGGQLDDIVGSENTWKAPFPRQSMIIFGGEMYLVGQARSTTGIGSGDFYTSLDFVGRSRMPFMLKMADSCKPCARGYFSDGQSSYCTKCPAGQFAELERSASCSPCTAGSYNSQTGQSTCALCPPGMASNATGATSKEVCRECVAGTYAASGADACRPCQPGTFASTNGMSACIPATAGYYLPIPGSNSSADMQICRAGSFSPPGSSQCISCNPGTASSAEGATTVSVCQPCPPGSFSSAKAPSCATCPKGTYSPVEGTKDQCITCPKGFYSPNTTACLPCSAGSYTQDDRMSSCVSCLGGFFMPNNGSGEPCRQCPAGWYSERTSGSTTCLPCPSGSTSTVGSTSCKLCNAGFSSSEGDDKCFSCPKGTYSPKPGSSCIPCDAGLYSEQSGSSSCSGCPPGSWSSSNSSACLPCQFGEYAPKANSSSCLSCPRSHFCPIASRQPIALSFTSSIAADVAAINISSIPDLFTNSSSSTDPFFAELTNSQSSNADKLKTSRIVIVCVFIGIIILVIIASLFAALVTCGLKHLRRPASKLLSFIDVFSLKHYARTGHALRNQGSSFGGICTLIWIVLALGLIALSLAEFFTSNSVSMSIVSESLLAEETTSSTLTSRTDPRVVGSYKWAFRLHNFLGSDCEPTRVDVSGVQTLDAYGTSGELLVQSGFGMNSTVDLLSSESQAPSTTCVVQVTCTNCMLASVPQISLAWTASDAAASTIETVTSIPYFKRGFPNVTSELYTYEKLVASAYDSSKLSTDSSLANSSVAAGSALFKGNTSPSIFSYSLTKTRYTSLAKDYIIYGLLSSILQIASDELGSKSSVGYSVAISPSQSGSIAYDDSSFASNKGLRVQVNMNLNLNALLIQEDLSSTLLDLLSKIAALISGTSTIIALIMRNTEKVTIKTGDQAKKSRLGSSLLVRLDQQDNAAESSRSLKTQGTSVDLLSPQSADSSIELKGAVM